MRVLILVVIVILSFAKVYAQCGCIDDMKNDPSKYSDRIELLFDGGFFTEGPAIDSKGNVYFTDLTFTSETGNQPGHIWKYSPSANHTSIYRSPSNMANGMIIKNDTLYTSEGADTGGRRLIKTDLASGKSYILTDKFNEKPYNSPNDLTIANDGTIYFTDPRYAGDESIEQPVNGVYRLNISGQVELIIDNILMPNGITVSPDNKKLYVGCNDENPGEDNTNFIAEYLIDKEGKVTFNKYVAKFLPPTSPDGIKLGKDGFIYAALRDPYRPGIYVYSPEGVLIEKVILPEDPSNLIFADESQEILYVTAGGNLYKVSLEN